MKRSGIKWMAGTLLTAFLMGSPAMAQQGNIPPANPTIPPPSATAPESSSYLVQHDMLCESASDCAVVATECPGWRGINKHYAAAAAQHVMAVRSYLNCAGSAEARPQPEAACIDKTCRVQAQ